MNPALFLVPALVNGACTILAYLGSRRRLLIGAIVVAGVLAIYLAALGLWPGPPSRHSAADVLKAYGTIASVVWLPGALLALLAGRRSGRVAIVLAVLAVALALLQGFRFVGIALAVACGLLGDCP